MILKSLSDFWKLYIKIIQYEWCYDEHKCRNLHLIYRVDLGKLNLAMVVRFKTITNLKKCVFLSDQNLHKNNQLTTLTKVQSKSLKKPVPFFVKKLN